MIKILDVLLDSLLDAAKIFPIIFLVYVLIEFLESRESSHERLQKIFGSRFSPVFGAGVGIIPQCGFSVVATRLYQDGFLLTGTLIAVYIATSDEALPILFSEAVTNPKVFIHVGLLIAIKFVYAVIAGFIINLFCKKQPTPVIDETNFKHEDELDGDGCCHHHITSERPTFKQLLLHPLIHSLKIILYIFAINILFGTLVYLIGEDNIKGFLASSVYLQPLLSTLVGLIPNCASSVIITEIYSEGYLTLGAAIAGLSINCGIGMAVLLRDKDHVGRSLLIIGLMLILSLAIGYGITGIGVLIDNPMMI